MFKPILWLLIISFFAGGCSTTPTINERTLVSLYSGQRCADKSCPIIFIPGMMGSILQDSYSGQTVWGEVGKRLLNALALPIDTVKLIVNRDSLIASGPLLKFAVIPGIIEKQMYDRLQRVAVAAGGYTMDEDAFVLSYDWRRDLVEAAAQLDSLIEKIKKKTNNPDIKVDLICHSAGGLIARYYVKYGKEDVLDTYPIPEPTYAGAKNIGKIIMLGTPNSGCLEAFMRLHQGFHIPMTGYIRPEVVFSMPSMYQLLPFDGRKSFLDRSLMPLNIDLYDPGNWEKYGWSVFNHRNQKNARKRFVKENGKVNGDILFSDFVARQKSFLSLVLRRAKRFHAALSQGDPMTERKNARYMVLGSDCQPTLNKAVLVQGDPWWKTEFGKKQVSPKGTYSFGDGSVTKSSLLGETTLDGKGEFSLPTTVEIFSYETHHDLALSPMCIDNILNLLLD